MPPIILHIDFDSFFASVEQQYNPSLRGKPVGVTAHNGRTAIIAASREAKRIGLLNVMRTYDAFKICPDLTLVTADFEKYWEISKQFLAICKDFSPFIEVFSLDEIFMDVTQTAHLFGGVEVLVTRMKERIKERIGEYITVSIGISHNKMLAKLASGLKKPNGVCTITPENMLSVYKEAKLTDICGIGERIKARLEMMGIATLLQLRRAPLHSLIAEFGTVEGNFLKNIGLGIDTTPLSLYTDPVEVKSVGRNYCLPKNEYDHRVVLQNIYELSEEVGLKLRRLKKKARTVGVYLRGTYDLAGRKTYERFFDTGKDIFELGISCLRESLLPQGYVRQISVWVSNLCDTDTIQRSFLFDTERELRLIQTIDAINEKFGDHTIRNGFLLYADKLTTVPNGFMADRYERMKLRTTEL